MEVCSKCGIFKCFFTVREKPSCCQSGHSPTSGEEKRKTQHEIWKQYLSTWHRNALVSNTMLPELVPEVSLHPVHCHWSKPVRGSEGGKRQPTQESPRGIMKGRDDKEKFGHEKELWAIASWNDQRQVPLAKAFQSISITAGALLHVFFPAERYKYKVSETLTERRCGCCSSKDGLTLGGLSTDWLSKLQNSKALHVL